MVRLNNAKNSGNSRFDDMASFITDTSSITNPAGLGFSYSSEEDDDDDENGNGGGNDEVSLFDSATSALTGLTGWTSANGGGIASTARGSARSHAGGGFGIASNSELGEESGNFPIAHAKSYKTANTSAYSSNRSQGTGFESAVSDLESRQVSGVVSFDVNGMLNNNGSVETSFEEIEVLTHGTSRSYKSKNRKQSNAKGAPPAVIPPPGQGQVPTSISPTSSTLSNTSNASKKRAPVPPLRDPNMEDKEEDQMWEEDCNYDINPTLMFLVLESLNWKEAIALLDGKNLENKNDAWNLGSLFGGKKTNTVVQAQAQQGGAVLVKKQQKELQVQARTWITRRERHGVLRWRMLPLHAALAFNAPFDVVLRLYHLYPGAVRCRNDQGMLPLHHVFKYGNEDKILELLLDVFPEALTVLDDKKRLPLGCTTKDGSDNERRSIIMTLFANFQVEVVMKKKEEEAAEASQEDESIKDGIAAITQQRSSQSLSSIKEVPTPRSPLSPAGEGGTLLGASAPRYSTNTDYNHVTYNSIKPLSIKKTVGEAAIAQPQVAQNNMKNLPLSPKAVVEDDGDKYAMLDVEDSENNPLNGNGRGRAALGGMGLSTIPEDGLLSPKAKTNALKAELLALSKKKKKGLRKLFGKKRTAQI